MPSPAVDVSTATTGAIKANVFCMLSMFTWAIGFPAAQLLLQSWGVVTLSMVRLSLVSLFLFVWWFFTEDTSTIKNAPWRKAMLIGAVGFGMGSSLLLVGQQMTNAVTAAIIAAMMPIAGAILEVRYDNRRLGLRLIVGMLFAIAGGLIATGQKLGHGNFGVGALLCVVSVYLFAWATRAATRELPGQSALARTALTLFGALVFMPLAMLVSLLFNFPTLHIGVIDSRHIIALFVFSIVSMAISQRLWIIANDKMGILLASFHLNAVPFYVMLCMVVLFNDSWIWWQAVGALFVGGGVLIAQSPAVKRRRIRPGL